MGTVYSHKAEMTESSPPQVPIKCPVLPLTH